MKTISSSSSPPPSSPSSPSHTVVSLRTIIEPRVQRGGLRPLPLPHPVRPVIRHLLIVLQSAKHALTQTSSTGDPTLPDGFFQWRFHSMRFRKVQAPPLINPLQIKTSRFISSSKKHRVKNEKDKPSKKTYVHLQHIHAIPLSTPKYLLENEVIPISVKSLNSIPSQRVSNYKIRVDRNARVEVKRQGQLDTFHASVDDTQLGSARVIYTPNKRLNLFLLIRQSIFSHSSWLPSTNKPSTSDALTTSHVDTITLSPSDMQSKGVHKPQIPFWQKWYLHNKPSVKSKSSHSSKAELNATTPNITTTNTATTTSVRPLSSSSKKNQEQQKNVVPIVNRRSRALRMETDYTWKEKRWTLTTGLDGLDGRAVSLRVVNNPWRFFSTIRTPLAVWASGDNVAKIPWICWMPEIGRSWSGQTQLGWREVVLSNVWKQGLMSLSHRKKDGSGITVSWGLKDKSGKMEKTIVRKAVKGKLDVTINGTIGNQKDQTGVSVSLHDGKSTMSVYGRTSRALGLSLDKNMQVGGHFYRVAFKTDDLKSVSVRLGWFD